MDAIRNSFLRLYLNDLKIILGESLNRIISNKLGGVALWLIIFNYCQAVLGFSINVWLANRLGPENFGILCYALVTGSFITLLVGFASDKTLVRDLIQSGDANAVLTASIVLRLAIAALVGTGCWIWLSFLPVIGSKYWPLVLCLIAAAIISLMPAAWYDAHYKMHLHAGITLGEKVLYGIFLLSAFFLYKLSAIIAAGALLISGMTSCLVQWGYALRNYSPSFRGFKRILKWLLQENWIIFLAALSNLCLTHANQLILAWKTDVSNLASYVIAFQIASFVQIFQGQIARLLDPKISRITMPGSASLEIKKSLIVFSLLSFAASVLLVLPIILLTPWVMKFFFRPEYMGAVKPLRVLCIWLVLFGPALVINRFLIGLRLNRQYIFFTFSAGILALGLGSIMIDHWGVTGVALTLLITHSYSVVGQFSSVYRRIGGRTVEN